MEDQLILNNAKKDIPKYFLEFKSFWDSTTAEFKDADLIKCYGLTLLFKNWDITLKHLGIKKLDGILKELHEDINASFYHAYFGHYRSAYMHLRSVIELSLQMLYFYQHEIEYMQWQNAEFRIKHDELTNYFKKHQKLNIESTINLLVDITKDWILFSKHIHAEAPNYFQSSLSSSKSKKISITDFGIWKSKFTKTGHKINKLFLLFFRDQLNSFPTNSRSFFLKNMKKKDLKDLNINE